MIVIEKKITEKVLKRLLKDVVFKISLPIEWIRYLKLEKGELVQLELSSDGIFISKQNSEKIENGSRIEENCSTRKTNATISN